MKHESRERYAKSCNKRVDFFLLSYFLASYVSSKNISKVNSKDSSLAYSPNLHRKFNLKVSSQATIKSKKKKKNSEVRPYAAKKEKRVKFTKANILIPFQRCNFLSSSSSSSSLPFLCETTTNLETSSPRTVLRPGTEVIHEN